MSWHCLFDPTPALDIEDSPHNNPKYYHPTHSGSMSYHKLKTNTKHLIIVKHEFLHLDSGLWTIRWARREKSERRLLGATGTTARDQIYRSSVQSPEETVTEQLYRMRYANYSEEGR